MDELKKYLQQHRSCMDFDEPSVNTWRPRRNRKYYIARYVAAAAVIVLLFTAAVLYLFNTPLSTTVAIQTPSHENHNTAPSLQSLPDTHSIPVIAVTENKKRSASGNKMRSSAQQETTTGFEHEIIQLVSELELEPIHIDNTQFFASLLEIWNELKEDEKKIIQECAMTGNNINTTDHLIQVYQKKIWILRQLQREITKINKQAILNYQTEQLPENYIKL